MKRYIWFLAVLLLAGGAAWLMELTPIPTPTSVGMEIDVGDGVHTFWVELTEAEQGKQVNIYQKQGDAQPVQSFVDEEALLDLELVKLTVEDINFDGRMDFHYYTSFGSSTVSHSSYYVWDPVGGLFAPDPYGLNDLSTLEFLPHNRKVNSLSCGPAGTTTVCYRYNGSLVEAMEESFTPAEGSGERAYTAHWVKADEAHTFWVEVAQREEWEWGNGTGIPVLVSVMDRYKGEVLQSFEEEVRQYSFEDIRLFSKDVDFDGCMDFGHSLWMAASSGGSAYYVWDRDREKFVRDPYGLEDLAMPTFYQDRKVIKAWNHSGNSYVTEFYRYLNGTLTCIRRLKNQDNDSDDHTATLTVEDYDYEKGELREVYREENAKIGGVTYASTREFRRWEHLDYRGGQALSLDVGDGEHTFWIETEDTGKPSYDGTVALIHIYQNQEDAQPLQTFAETLYTGSPVITPVDVDFDGDMDFSVFLHSYRSIGQKAYYIWDETKGKFVPDPYGLNGLNHVELDPERKVVKEELGGMGIRHTCYYRYEKDVLLCVRVLDWWFNSETGNVDLLVEDGWDGELKTVYKCEVDVDEWWEGTGGAEEFDRWYDLSYPGE